jgi:hypothetical protein
MRASPAGQALLHALGRPLQPPLALRIGALALLTALSLLLLHFGRPGLAAVGVLALVQGLYAAAFAIDLMGRSAQGFVRSAGSRLAGTHASAARTLMLLALGVAMAALIGAAHLLPLSLLPIWLLVVALAALALPAAIVQQVLSTRLGSAVVRGSLLDVAARLDRQHLRLAVAILAAALVGAALLLPAAHAGGLVSLLRTAAAGQPSMPGAGQLLLALFVATALWYLVFLICTLTGRAMYLRAEALRIAVRGSGDARDALVRPIDQDRQLRDDALEQLVAEGDVRAALKQVHDALAEQPQSLALHARLYRLLKIEGYLPRIEHQAQVLVHLLLNSGNGADALALAAEALARDPHWQPRDADDIVPLAHAAFMAGQPQLAAHLIRGFDRRHREHPHIASAYLLGAKLLMLQGEAQHVQARAVLDHLNASFPGSQEATESQPLLHALDQWDRQRAAASAAPGATSDRAD